MGMDVCGRAPHTKQGEYFRNNMWWWRPLADYICEIAPEITANCQHWHSNDGDGLNGHDSLRLAELLQKEIESGRTAAYARRRESKLEMAPNEPCLLCEATGTRKPPPDGGAGDSRMTSSPCAKAPTPASLPPNVALEIQTRTASLATGAMATDTPDPGPPTITSLSRMYGSS